MIQSVDLIGEFLFEYIMLNFFFAALLYGAIFRQ